MVGTSCRMTMRTMVSMALRPRSSTRVRPPVLRSRWKRSDSSCMCSKVRIGEPAHRVHRHLGEHAVAHLRQRRHQDAHAAIGDRHGDRRGEHPDQPVGGGDRRAALAGQRIGRPFEGEGNRDGGELGGEQQHHRAQHAQLAGRAGRPARYRATGGASVDSSAPRLAETAGVSLSESWWWRWWWSLIERFI